MPANYTIQADPEQLAELQRRLKIWGGNASEVLRIAINDTGKRAKSSTALPGGGASQRLRARYNIKDAARAIGTTPVKYINERLKVWSAQRNNLVGKVYAPTRGMLLSPFRQNAGVPPTPLGGPTVNVLLSSGRKQVGRIQGTISKPFYIKTRPKARADGSVQPSQILIVGRRATPGPKGGMLLAARTISVSQAFNTLKDDMLPTVQQDFVNNQVRVARYLLQKLQVPMEQPQEP